MTCIFHNREVIQENDWVIVYVTPEDTRCMQVTKDAICHCRLGSFRLADAIGKSFGCTLTPITPSSNNLNSSSNTKHASSDHSTAKRIALLRPTPELWTASLSHRTQILYPADAAFIIGMLGIGPGSRVLESGTGSGSMTHWLAAAVMPEGHVESWEAHPIRCKLAQQDIIRHGLQNVVSVRYGKAYGENEGMLPSMASHEQDIPETFLSTESSSSASVGDQSNGDENGSISGEQSEECPLVGFDTAIEAESLDAVFLDLPKPWLSLPAVMAALKKGVGRVCCFSPCIEQIQSSLSVMETMRMLDISLHEINLRPWELVKGHANNYRRLDSNGTNNNGNSSELECLRMASMIRSHTSYLLFGRKG